MHSLKMKLMPKPEDYNSISDLTKLKREARRIDEEGKSIQSSTTNVNLMHGGDEHVPGQIDRVNSKVRFAPNSGSSSFAIPNSFNADSSHDITNYEGLNETREGHESGLAH